MSSYCIYFTRPQHLRYILSLKRRIREKRQRISLVLSAASLAPNELIKQSGFTQWDVEIYIQLMLGTVVLNSTKLKLLTDRAGASLLWAVSACQFVLSESGGTLWERLGKLLECRRGDTSEVYECILEHKLKRIDIASFASKRLELAYIVGTAPNDWSTSEAPHRIITIHCLELMEEALRFNICQIESSDLHNERIEGLEDRIESCISPALLYVCTNWTFHASFALSHPHLAPAIISFLHNHSLKWLEVMSLKKQDPRASLDQLCIDEASTNTFCASVHFLNFFKTNRQSVLI